MTADTKLRRGLVDLIDGYQDDDFEQLTARIERVHAWTKQNGHTEAEGTAALDLHFRANLISPNQPGRKVH